MSSTAITLSWEPPLIGDQNGIITAYFVQLTELESGITSNRTSNSLNLTVPSLHPYYNYQWTVAAMTIALGPSSTPSIVQTNEDGVYYNSYDMKCNAMRCIPMPCSSINLPSKHHWQSSFIHICFSLLGLTATRRPERDHQEVHSQRDCSIKWLHQSSSNLN